MKVIDINLPARSGLATKMKTVMLFSRFTA